MQTLKKFLFILCFTFNFVGLQSIVANPIILTESNYLEVVEHLFSVYGSQIEISEGDLEAYLLQWANPTADCDVPEVSIIGETPGSVSFNWPAIMGAASYSGGFISLESGATFQTVTTIPGLTFTNLQAELYLFAFLTDCGFGRSKTHIIIVEKDLFRIRYDDIAVCFCEGDDEPLGSSGTLFPVINMGWSRNCPYFAQYRMNFSGEVSSEGVLGTTELAFSITTIHSEEEQAVGIQTCTDGQLFPINTGFGANPSGPNPDDYFNANFSGDGVEVSFDNTQFELETSEAVFCGCTGPIVLGRNGTTEKIKAAFNSTENTIRYFPNPFQDKVKLQFLEPIEGDFTIDLFNTNGQVLLRTVKKSPAKGSHDIELDLSGYAAGLYYCRIQSKNQIQSVVLVKTSE